MKVQNQVKQNLESAKNKKEWIERVIKDSLVSLFPNQVDKNTKIDFSHSVSSVASARRKTTDYTINGRHCFVQMKPRFYHSPKKRGQWIAKK